MAIINTMSNGSDLYHDLQKTDSYKNNFSYEGAIALFDYLDQLSEDIGENIEYDPIAWCIEYSEYENMKEFWNDSGYPKNEYPTPESLQDDTEVIEFDGGIIVRDF